MSTRATGWCALAVVIAASAAAVSPAEARWRHRARAQPCPHPTCPAVTTKVRILLIGDTILFPGNATEASAEGEMDHVSTALGAVLYSGQRDDRVQVATIRGDQVTPDKILAFIRDWDVTPSEAIFCYFTSHGNYDPTIANSDPSGGHYFYLGERGFIYHTTLLRALQSKNARLTVLFGDSCNQADKPFRVVAETVVEPATAYPNFAESLFLGHTGVVSLNSAEVGKEAWVGKFSRAVMETCNTGPESPLYRGLYNWPGFLRVLSDKTFQISGQIPGNDYRPVVYQLDVRPAPLPPGPTGPRQRTVFRFHLDK